MKNSIASKFAYLAALAFIAAIITSSVLLPPETYTGQPPLSVILSVSFFIIFHLAMLPVISALRAPDWAKTSGIIWVAIDNMLEMMSFFGVAGELIIPMRWGIHLATATWLIGVGLEHRGFFRIFSFIVAALLIAVTLAGPFLERSAVAQTLGAAGVPFIIWIFTAGFKLNKGYK